MTEKIDYRAVYAGIAKRANEGNNQEITPAEKERGRKLRETRRIAESGARLSRDRIDL